MDVRISEAIWEGSGSGERGDGAGEAVSGDGALCAGSAVTTSATLGDAATISATLGDAAVPIITLEGLEEGGVTADWATGGTTRPECAVQTRLRFRNRSVMLLRRRGRKSDGSSRSAI